MQTVLRLTAAVAALALLALPILGSSHREAPFVTEHPKVDGTDFYMFRSYEEGRDGFVTLIANYIPLQDAYGGPNYFTMDPSARYRINIENDGDPEEDIVFEFRFFNILRNQALPIGGADVDHPLRTIFPVPPFTQANEVEGYTVTVIRDGGPPESAMNLRAGNNFFAKALDYFGEKTFSDYEAYAAQRVVPIGIPGCDDGRVFVGQRKESFAVNLGEVFDLVNLNPVGDPDAKRSSTEDKNVTALALEVPIDCLSDGGSDTIGGWTTALLPRTRELNPDPTFSEPADESSDFVQVSRLGNPLVNELVIGLPDKNRFNASRPADDGQFATYVTNPTLPFILEVLFPVQAPTNFPREDLLATFITGIDGLNNFGLGDFQRLNTGISPMPRDLQDNLGVIGGDNAGFPNGRRPGDDVVDIALRVLMGRLCHLGLGLCDPPDAPSGLLDFTDQTYQGPDQFDDVFPYLTTPLPGSPNPYRTFNANLQGSQEVPPESSPWSGACGAVLSADETELAVSCMHNVPDVIAAHIHQAPAGHNGSIVCGFTDASSPIQFVCPVDASLLEALQRGNTYVNIHSATNQPGEIRGQLR